MEATDRKKTKSGAWRAAGWGVLVLILLHPLVAMQFTDEVNWGVMDFVVAAILLGAAGLGLELAVRMSSSAPYRLAAAVAIAATFLLIWVNLAVGFLGSEDDPANLLFFGVLAVAAVGSVAARFQAAGAARAMAATAFVQLVVGIVALSAGLGSGGDDGLYEVVMGTGFFCALWLLSAWLFRKAAVASGPP